MRIGVLAMQGAYREHLKILKSLGIEAIDVRYEEDIDNIDGLIIPGGESTTMGKLIKTLGLYDKLKSRIENNHNYVRDIITNELDISNITQQDLDLVFSHINSTPRESLNGKTPYELQEFLYGKEIIEKLNIKQIKRDEVILKPYLIKHIYK